MISAGRRQKKKAVAQQPFDTPIRPAAALNDQGRRFSFARHRIGGLRPDVAGVHVDDIPVNEHFPGIGGKVLRVELGHFLLDQGPFFRRHRDAQHDLTLSVCHCGSRSFPAKGFGDFPNKQNGRPGRGGTGRFSEVWLHFLCLLFLFFSAISTFGKPQTTRKTGTSPEKSAKK